MKGVCFLIQYLMQGCCIRGPTGTAKSRSQGLLQIWS
jgi:hypothetical protein